MRKLQLKLKDETIAEVEVVQFPNHTVDFTEWVTVNPYVDLEVYSNFLTDHLQRKERIVKLFDGINRLDMWLKDEYYKYEVKEKQLEAQTIGHRIPKFPTQGRVQTEEIVEQISNFLIEIARHFDMEVIEDIPLSDYIQLYPEKDLDN